MGLLEDDEEWIYCMTETAFTASLSQLRHLFATILLFCNLSSPVTLWDTFKKQLSEDFYYQLYTDERSTLNNSCSEMALIEINKILAQHKKTLTDFELPETTHTELPMADNDNYDQVEQHEISRQRQAQMNAEQKKMHFKLSWQSKSAQKIIKTPLTIWDEAPMMNRMVFECLSRSMSDLIDCSKPFGGKVVVLGGDFRQVLFVVPKGRQADILNVTLNKSYLWDYIKIIHLRQNMRVGNDGQSQQWLLRTGNGTEEVHNDIGEMAIQIPTELCQPDTEALITSVYNDFNENYSKEEYLLQRAILTTTHENVYHVNDKMIKKINICY